MHYRALFRIDEDLYYEVEIWHREQRAGKHCPDAEAAMRRIDRLLDERFAHPSRKRRSARRPQGTPETTG